MLKQNEHIIIWKRESVDTTTIETLRLIKVYNDYSIKSIVNGTLAGKPLLIEYRISIDKTWNVKTVEIESKLNDSLKISLKTDSIGKWFNNDNQEIKELNGCIDIDIAITPFTNTLPIRRLGSILKERTKINVLYFDIASWSFKKVEQYYTMLDSNLYKYEGAFRNFTANLPTDNYGFVTSYPNLFKRIYPN
jgi:hypothetical protein